MTPLIAYKKLKSLEFPIFSTSDVAGILQVSNKHASKILVNLKDAHFLTSVKKGLWCIREKVDLFMLPEYFSAPLPSYISLQSALYHHGLISQIPSSVYAVTLGRTKNYNTNLGSFSMHQIDPALFHSFNVDISSGIKIASKEKALFDFFYFSSAKSSLFSSLPEVDLDDGFDWDTFLVLANSIKHKSRKTMVLSKICRMKKLR